MSLHYAHSYRTSRGVMAQYLVGVVIPAQLMRAVASHLIGYGCPARQYELELF